MKSPLRPLWRATTTVVEAVVGWAVPGWAWVVAATETAGEGSVAKDSVAKDSVASGSAIALYKDFRKFEEKSKWRAV